MEKDKAKALERLQRVLDEIPSIKQTQRSSPQFTKWHRNARVAIAWVFNQNTPQDQDTPQVADFDRVDYSPDSIESDEWPYMEQDERGGYIRGLEQAEAVIESMIQEVEYWPDAEPADGPTDNFTDGDDDRLARRVFIIHGRDQGAKADVARFVEQVGLEPVILSEKPNQGKTIIEKFEANSKVGYAIALLTGDDIGALDSEEDSMRPRARQNVIFELGFFIGRLDRSCVCALTRGDPEIPSDYSGVVYIPMDEDGAWQGKLVKELKTKFRIDANKLYD